MSEAVAVPAPPQLPSSYVAAWRTIRGIIANDRKAQIGAAILVGSIIVAIIGPYIAPHDVEQPNVAIRLTGPTLSNIMGTDHLGRDLFSRIISGLTVSLLVATGAVLIAVVIGVPLGAFAGYQGGWIDTVIMRIMDAIIAMPGRLLAIALVAAIGPSVGALWVAISFSSVPRYARLIRGGVLAQREREYVEAARAIGESSGSTLLRYVLPNAMAPVVVQITLNFASAITAEASLSFLGLGLVPPTISWGQMLSGAQDYLEVAPWLAIFPGLALTLLIMGFVLLGDALRDHLDPRYHGRRRARKPAAA
ncbi:MAG: ABC transporter permease [Chloroflexi bacterium]|nr:ABC transporter permease [Chloroflexota bacterium]